MDWGRFHYRKKKRERVAEDGRKHERKQMPRQPRLIWPTSFGCTALSPAHPPPILHGLANDQISFSNLNTHVHTRSSYICDNICDYHLYDFYLLNTKLQCKIKTIIT